MGSGNKTSVLKVLPVHWRNFSLSQTANKSPGRRKVCLEESILLCSTTRGIQPTEADTGAITQHKTNLQKLDFQSCNVPPTPTTMLTSQTSPVSAAPPSGRGMGGLGTEFLTTLDTTMMEMDLILDAPGTIREFNTGTSNINTPNIATEDDAYEFVFKETDFGTEATVATTIEDTEYKTIHNIEMELIEDTDLTENVWGADSFGVFESNDFGLCAPANLVEGAFNAFDDLIEDDVSENVTVVHQHSNEDPLEIENVDLLQWIVNDQAINIQEDMTENAAEQKMTTKTEVDRVSVIVPVTSLSPPVPVSEVKIELLSEDEKYREMRVQNNEASTRCRANRKRKHLEMEEEVVSLQKRNVELREKMAAMEAEVKMLKRRLLSDISVPSKILA